MNTRRSSLFLCSLVVLIAAAGCSVTLPGAEEVTSHSGATRKDAGRDRTPDQRRADFPIDHGDYRTLGYRLDWIGYPTITGSLPIRFIAPYDDFIAVIEQGGRLTVLDSNTGGRRCGDQIGSQLTRFMGLDRSGDQLIVSTQAEVFGLNPTTCNLMTRFRTDKIVSTGPLIHGNLMIFGTGAGEILAHAIMGGVEGVKAWGFATDAAIEGRPVLMGDAVGAVSQNGQVTFVHAQSGNLIGRARIWGGLATNPIADDHTMYIASLDQSIYAIAADGGTMLWRHRTPYSLREQPTLRLTDEGSVLYAAVPGQGLLALDGASGSILWTAPNFQGTIVAANRGRLVGFDGESAVLLDPQRGDILERVKLPGVLFLKADRFEDGSLFVVSRSGVVARFNAR